MDYSALEGKIKQYYDTQEKFADAMGISRSALNQKLNNSLDFTTKNIYTMIDLLHIPKEEIHLYFFEEKV